MIFFDPLPNFLSWIKRLSEKTQLLTIDCGCGDGHLIRAMREAGIKKVLGVDPRYEIFDEQIPPDLVNAIIPCKAQDWRGLQDNPLILLVCRPCHDGFPAEINRVRHPKSRMFYVGSDEWRCVDTDCAGKLVYKKPVGKEDEMLWELSKPK